MGIADYGLIFSILFFNTILKFAIFMVYFLKCDVFFHIS